MREYAFITVLQTTENTRVVGEFKGLILASTVWSELLSSGFYFCDMYSLQSPKQMSTSLFL